MRSRASRHGVFGTSTKPCPVYCFLARPSSPLEDPYINFVPGVVKGFAFAIDEFTDKGDKIIIQPPVYPFRIVTRALDEKVNNPLT